MEANLLRDAVFLWSCVTLQKPAMDLKLKDKLNAAKRVRWALSRVMMMEEIRMIRKMQENHRCFQLYGKGTKQMRRLLVTWAHDSNRVCLVEWKNKVM